MSTPKPTATELAHARATLSRRAPGAPEWVASRIAQNKARKRAEKDREREARARRELIDQARGCNTCGRPMRHVTRPGDTEVCACGT